MRAYITRIDGTKREVKNLGWLLSHADQVTHVTLSNRDDGARCGCLMVADLRDGTKYTTVWNSHKICLDWMKRRRCLSHVEFADYVTELSTSNP